MNDEVYRVEARNHQKGFDLLGIRYSVDQAKELISENDDYFVRAVDCLDDRKVVYRNYSWQDLLSIDV